MRIRRASLLSLLSICVTAQQRRLLRTHGYANFRRILDGFFGLSFESFENFDLGCFEFGLLKMCGYLGTGRVLMVCGCVV